MIPSRPLFLGDVIGETIRITKTSYWRSVIASLIFLLLPGILLIIGLLSFITTFFQRYQAEDLLTSATLKDARIMVIRELSVSNPVVLTVYGIDPNTALKDSIVDKNVLSKENFSRIFRKHIDDYILSFVEIGLGIILLLVGYCGLLAALFDLSSRVFENRIVSLRRALSASLRKNMWLLIAQWGIYLLSIIIGLGFFIGIGAVISPVIAAFCFFCSMVLIFYTAIRILLAQVIIVSEETGPIEAMKRSWQLTEGHFWRFLGYLIVLEILFFVINSIFSIPFSFISGNDIITNFLNGTESNPYHFFEGLKNF